MTAVDEIKARLDIIDVVSEHVPLTKSGRNFKGVCPFHAEKTPSFFVFPETQTWHCFGACGTGGDVLSFVMKIENLDFSEALQVLAPKAGVQLAPPRQRDVEKDKHLDKLFDINAAAAAYFFDVLVRLPKGETGRAYAAERGLNKETIQKFQLGLAPDEWRSVSNHLLERGYQRKDLLELGLIIARDDGGFYDRFRGRFIVPIRDVRGQVIGFGGRILGEGQPKYLNSPQTPLFTKSHVLFGLDLAKGAIRAKGRVVIAEGYMDVLQAHQAGFGNVVASMGTALTEHQLALLKRMTKTYILALDPDLAGDQGTLRGLTVARQTLDRQTVPVPTAKGWIRYESRLDADIRIMTLPAGQDPDDLIRDTPEQWEPLVEASLPVVDYYFRIVTQDLDLSEAKAKSEAVRRLAPAISEIRDEVERTHYVQKLSRMIRVDDSIIRRQLSVKVPGSRTSRPSAPAAPQKPRSLLFEHEEHCLAVLLRHPSFLERINALLAELGLVGMQEDDFSSTENRTLFLAWMQFEEGQDWAEWVGDLGTELQQHLDLLLSRGPDTADLADRDVERDIERRALELRLKNVKRTSQNLQVLQAEALDQGDAKATEYAQATLALARDRRRLQQWLSERTAMAQRERDQVR